MCRFKALFTFFFISLTLFQYILCVGSSLCQSSLVESLFLFQYILCVGSRICLYRLKKLFQRFNTSYVSVQVGMSQEQQNELIVFQYILCVGSSACIQSERRYLALFQYILCVGSRTSLLAAFKTFSCFNTSYVSVQGGVLPCRMGDLQGVSIHPMCRFKLGLCH